MVNASPKLPPHRNAIFNIRKLVELLARCLHTSSASGTTLYFRRCGIDGRRPRTNDPGAIFVDKGQIEVAQQASSPPFIDYPHMYSKSHIYIYIVISYICQRNVKEY